MPQLLLELFSEEIPARMQAGAARDLERLARERLTGAELGFEGLRAFAGPRRLTLVVDGLPSAQGDRREERKGPRIGAPEAAMEGFLRSVGLLRHQLVERDGAYFAHLHRAGRPTAEIVAEMVEAIVRGFPWPKSMTWGEGKLRWVRPLRRILCVFDREVIRFGIEGLEASDLTEGHRFMGPRRPFRARDFDEYREGLAGHFVVLDPQERKDRILAAAQDLCDANGLEFVEDQGLLDEVAGLAEWPAPILGQMDPKFLELPPEVIRTSMRVHQRYFAVRYPGVEALAPRFVVVANIEAADGGALVAAGAARVLSARLQDARFFWEEDLKVPLENRLERLKGVTFHAKLGTMHERVERIEALARELAPLVGAEPGRAALAARLAKADLVSGMVSEFPELQGVMGGHYARAEGLGEDLASAIADHYRPAGPSDAVPTAPVTVAVALADKLDTMAGFFAIGEKPTGSRDPFALRRAALGLIRIILAGQLRLAMRQVLKSALYGPGDASALVVEILVFLADRLKVQLREDGRRHDLVDAVFALGDDDLVRIVRRVEALEGFLGTEDGANLLAGHKRASNILNAEAKKGVLPSGAAAPMAEAPAEEAALIRALAKARPEVEAAAAGEDFAGAMRALAALRAPVDAFFDKVLVNSPVPEERDNRLRLLLEVRAAMDLVADFSLVSG
ncbi:MAG: glycine--tRNA ligase subunit beta [Caulobacteraceae bacterium]|nr:glycine--tRNA ligase subunit beta [Caulobacteraceae bacterium]